jgi:glutaredoxin
MAAMATADVVLFSRRSCHLCDEARAIIQAEHDRSGFAFQEIVIDGDDALEDAYGLRVPVVSVGGTEVFEYTVDPEELRRLVSG